MRDDGFIVVRNPLLRNSIWLKYGGYFLDLVRYAVFRDTTVSFKGVQVPLAKGQCLVSMRFLERRWHVPKSTAHRWLRLFERVGLIRRKVIRIPGTNDGTDRVTLVTIVNYSDYQSLDKHARRVRDADRDADRYKEEGSMKKEAAAVVASDRENPAGPRGAGEPRSEAEAALEKISEIHRQIIGGELKWSASDLAAAVELCDTVGLPTMVAVVRRVAERQTGKGSPPKHVGYYFTAIREDGLKTEPERRDARLARLAEGSGDLPPKPACHRVVRAEPQEDPELGEGYGSFRDFFKEK